MTLSTTGANGKVIADAVAFVKIEDNEPPVAANVQVAGGAFIGGTMTGSYDYSDPENDLEGDSRFRWYRSDDAVLDAGDAVISGATGQSYVVQPGDAGKYLFFEVTPVALTGLTSGTPVQSAASAQIAPNDPPTATAVSISGTPHAGRPAHRLLHLRRRGRRPRGGEPPPLVPQRRRGARRRRCHRGRRGARWRRSRSRPRSRSTRSASRATCSTPTG